MVDVNVWLALTHDGHEHHDAAVRWFDSLSSREAFFCRTTQVAYLRLLTNQRIAQASGVRPATLTQAWAFYDALWADPRVDFLAEPADFEAAFRKMSSGPLASTKVVADSYLAAFANQWHVGLATLDKGFVARGGLEELIVIA
ncbi:MAG: TA system VapC family ribonuclease toxin [Bryobacterales bacterium]